MVQLFGESSLPSELTLKDFSYELPAELIAQTPLSQRDESRLIFADARSRQVKDSSFKEIVKNLVETYQLSSSRKLLLVANDSRVYPARVRIRRQTGGRGEVFLLESGKQHDIPCLLRPLKKMKIGEILFSDRTGEALFCVTNLSPTKVSPVENKKIDDILSEFGEMPLPPYIERDPEKVGSHAEFDKERYQTVYSQRVGSSAAPTAGLHFTAEIIEECQKNFIEFSSVTLHVGLGTFQPVQTELVAEHVMHEETYCLNPETCAKILTHLENNWPIVFVGTTSLRTVESFFRKFFAAQSSQEEVKLFLKNHPDMRENLLQQSEKWHTTQLFLYPRVPSERLFPLVGDALITNFHQPGSTLVMLVASLLGYGFWKELYQHAVQQKYRFLSYGDSCLFVLR